MNCTFYGKKCNCNEETKPSTRARDYWLSFRTWRRGIAISGEDTQDAKAKVAAETEDFPHVFGLDNFRRGDAKVRTYILASILAHRDAEVDSVRPTAIIDFGRQGCHEQNLDYFNDYREHGRHLGRGHLFVGTLPTTPPCEAAISLKLTGPCFYTIRLRSPSTARISSTLRAQGLWR